MARKTSAEQRAELAASLPPRLRAVANLSEFSAASGIPRRTLVRMLETGADVRTPSLETLERVDAALRAIKPAKKSAAKLAAAA